MRSFSIDKKWRLVEFRLGLIMEALLGVGIPVTGAKVNQVALVLAD
jgi:hypothetical protein